MKLNVELTTEESVGLLDDVEYSFEAGPHMMQILSGLYANPEVALVREYLTNMYDAHIALHRATGSWGPKPTLSLPTTFTPTLVFADKGIGMSKETVKRIYTRYGKSTKSDSNDEVGGFGLGAKVAFAYNGGVDWTVASVRDGEKNTFIARIGPNGMPVLSHLDCSPTTEPSGTTVTIPVRRQDIGTIQNTAKTYLRHFPLPINVENASFTITPVVSELSGDVWSVGRGGGYGSNGLTVVVGNVPYNIPEPELVGALRRGGLLTSNSNDAQYFWTQNEVTIKLAVGSVDIVPSRDSVQFTDRTKDALAKALQATANAIKAEISKMVQAAPTEYDALLMLEKVNNLSYIGHLTQTADYKGRKISRVEGIVRKVTDFPGTTFSCYGITKSDSGEIVEKDCSTEVSVGTNNNTRILFVNTAKGEIRVAKALAHKNLVNKTKGGRASRWGGHKIGHVLLVKTTLSKDEFSKRFGGYPVALIENTSDYADVKAPSGTGINAENIYRFNGRSWEARVRVPVDTDVRYYLPLTKGYARFSYQDDHYAVAKLINEASRLGLVDQNYRLYGIKTDEVKNFDAALWVNLNDAITAKIIADIPVNANDLALWKAYGSWKGHKATKAAQAFDFIPEVSGWLVLVEKHMTQYNKANDFQEIVQRHINTPAVEKEYAKIKPWTGENINTAYDKLVKKYPMVALAMDTIAECGIYVGDRGKTTAKRYEASIREYVKMISGTP
jgi:Histidine kinase-, DNA gyrase B-, and HSP90-like ATPase